MANRGACVTATSLSSQDLRAPSTKVVHFSASSFMVEAGFRIVAVTNAVQAVAEAQPTNAGICPCFVPISPGF